MFQVDAFTSRLFSGNPAAVLRVDEWLSDEIMLAIAQENNLAETAFVKPIETGFWDLRWFTPTHEVNFCGHATLATAHVLRTEYGTSGKQVFRTRVGEISVEQQDNKYQLDIPAFHPEELVELPSELNDVFRSEPEKIFRNFENIFVDVGTDDAVLQFVPDDSKIALLGEIGLAITGQGAVEFSGKKPDFVSRYFAPGAGIPEDPVTGSTHATLVPYWVAKLGRDDLTAFQASSRGGWLECRLSGSRVFLCGHAVTFMRADVMLPTP